jgi:peptidoglycan/xylan/chitin deacetylase (PgdA/CDA1 family)
VVQRWLPGISDDPGTGVETFNTGYSQIPILGDLVRLGHRVGNHTLNHPLLTRVASQVAQSQIVDNQRGIDPFITNELRLFRAPGGAWSEPVAVAVSSDPILNSLVGPIRWDIDEKDWQDSIECTSSRPASDCERASHRASLRLKASVAARRYLHSIQQSRHGIVLLHDRVGDVGTRYALDLARALIPALKERRYVFAAPILAFSPLKERQLSPAQVSVNAAATRAYEPSRLLADARAHYGDLNGDGLLDHCNEDESGISCSLARAGEYLEAPMTWASHYCDSVAKPTADPTWHRTAGYSTFRLADVDGDGLSDCCAQTLAGIQCALSDGGAFTQLEHWSFATDFSESDPRAWFRNPAYGATVQFADINGDGRADVCGRSADGVACAFSTGHAFTAATRWLSTGMTDADGWLERDPSDLRLTDINNDGRADWCSISDGRVACGLAP